LRRRRKIFSHSKGVFEVSDEIELISDGDGLAIIGTDKAVAKFLKRHDLVSAAKNLELKRIGSAALGAAEVAQAAIEFSAQSGRWVKLTEESAKLMSQLPLMTGSTGNVGRAIVMAEGKTAGILEIVRGSGTMLASPAVLPLATGLMAQMAMKQAMKEITDYLATIDAKVDDVLRAQKDAVLSEMIGVELTIEEAMAIRENVGRVSETIWSKVQASSTTIASTQAYALRQLDALAEKLEKSKSAADISKAANTAAEKAQEWLAVLGRSIQLQAAFGVLELDRVLDASPDEVDRHRIALHTAQRSRQARIKKTTDNLIARMNAAASRANTKVLLAPLSSKSAVGSSNTVVRQVTEFHRHIGLDEVSTDIEARKWIDAATEARDNVVEAGAAGMGSAAHAAGQAFNKVGGLVGGASTAVAEKLSRNRRAPKQGPNQEELDE
jgi:hypothetical protein